MKAVWMSWLQSRDWHYLLPQQESHRCWSTLPVNCRLMNIWGSSRKPRQAYHCTWMSTSEVWWSRKLKYSASPLPRVNVGLQEEVLAALEGSQVCLCVCVRVYVCVSKTPVLLCSVLGKVVKSWQAISKPGQASPAALAVKAMNSLFVPTIRKQNKNICLETIQDCSHSMVMLAPLLTYSHTRFHR